MTAYIRIFYMTIIAFTLINIVALETAHPAEPVQSVADRQIIIDLSEQQFWLMLDGEVIYSGPVSSGKNGRTPTGEFKVGYRQRNKRSGRYPQKDINGNDKLDKDIGEIGALMKHAVQLTGHIFSHRGKLPGYPASHGCVRMTHEGSLKAFEFLRRGDKVIIKK